MDLLTIVLIVGWLMNKHVTGDNIRVAELIRRFLVAAYNYTVDSWERRTGYAVNRRHN